MNKNSACLRILLSRLIGWRFRAFVGHSLVYRPLFLSASFTELGYGVYIEPNARIEVVQSYAGLRYGRIIAVLDQISVEQDCHVTCPERIASGARTSISASVAITENALTRLSRLRSLCSVQPVLIGSVEMGAMCEIYNNNMVILPWINMGDRVAGANPVVRRGLAPCSIAADVPVKIVKRYRFVKHKWLRVS